jgi:hypothetical protein
LGANYFAGGKCAAVAEHMNCSLGQKIATITQYRDELTPIEQRQASTSGLSIDGPKATLN